MFSWDVAKNISNQRKHGVSFETAQLVFDDPFNLTRLTQIENGEHRWQTIGMVGGVLLLMVVHTYIELESGEEQIRIISARRTTKREREFYEQGT